ncbi:MAG TPA: PP2C family protein-serine/threonine phosphatase [Thermoanaerobaculia bacterium]|nr:PP2C family protein-serine/threonine phosphatase [Thermoanaerobaculia bacterium]
MTKRLKVSQRPIGRAELFVWLGLLIAGALAVSWLYPRAFPLRPREWQLTRAEAVRLVEERIRQLGDPVAEPYTTVSLYGDPELELSLLRRGGVAPPELSRGVLLWRVSVYESGGRVGQWRYRAEVALDGELVSLLRGTPDDYRSDAVPDAGAARARAGELLQELGLELAGFGEPTVRRVDLGRYVYTYVRYAATGARLGGFEHGVEVRFAGDQLEGFYTWRQDRGAAADESALRSVTLVRTLQLLVVFLFLPPLLLLFVRRYHEGVVGVARAAQVGLGVIVSCLVVLLLAARPMAEAVSMGNLTRAQMTWVWVAWMLVIYVPALGVLAFASCALGEARAHGLWRRRLAPFAAFCERDWTSSTVAASSLRGTASGVLLAAAVLGSALLLRELGATPLLVASLGPWWESAALPGVALLAVVFAYALAWVCFGLLFLLPPLAESLGIWLGGAVAAGVTAITFLPPLLSAPVIASVPVWFLVACATVVLFVRYDLLVAFLASLVSRVVLEALPLLTARDASLELQGWTAVLASAAPLLVGARWLGSTRVYRYQHDDVPPHVRRIAERERQRVELETARRIQSSILPMVPKRVLDFELASIYLPASEVGGDFYDVRELPDGRLALAIGDVAGHGVSSGLVMSMARAALLVQTRFDPEVEGVVHALNRVVCEAGPRLLTTLCYVVLDPRTRRARFACAGHVWPYRVSRSGEVGALESTAYPLGVRAQLDLDVREHDLHAGDALVLSSDGLVEARRIGGEEPFGYERLEESLRRHAAGGGGGEALLRGLLGDVELFLGAGRRVELESVGRDDDLTVLVVTVP